MPRAALSSGIAFRQLDIRLLVENGAQSVVIDGCFFSDDRVTIVALAGTALRGVNGGQCRTRTCDLLLVRQAL